MFDSENRWLAGTEGTEDDNIMMVLLQCFLSNKAYRPSLKSLQSWLKGGCKVRERVEPVEIRFYVPDPDKPDTLKYDHSKTVGEVERELKARLNLDGFWDNLGYFNVSAVYEREFSDLPFPKHRWISCYAVTGDSEGHYIYGHYLLEP